MVKKPVKKPADGAEDAPTADDKSLMREIGFDDDRDETAAATPAAATPNAVTDPSDTADDAQTDA